MASADTTIHQLFEIPPGTYPHVGYDQKGLPVRLEGVVPEGVIVFATQESDLSSLGSPSWFHGLQPVRNRASAFLRDPRDDGMSYERHLYITVESQWSATILKAASERGLLVTVCGLFYNDGRDYPLLEVGGVYHRCFNRGPNLEAKTESP